MCRPWKRAGCQAASTQPQTFPPEPAVESRKIGRRQEGTVAKAKFLYLGREVPGPREGCSKHLACIHKGGTPSRKVAATQGRWTGVSGRKKLPVPGTLPARTLGTSTSIPDKEGLDWGTRPVQRSLPTSHPPSCPQPSVFQNILGSQ